MPIKHLDGLLFEVKSSNTCALEVLKNARIGIDAEHYISKLISPKKDINLQAIGGFPVAFEGLLDNDLKAFEELNITPVFVFPGLQTVDQYKYYATPETLPVETQIRKAWDDRHANKYYDGFRDMNSTLPIRPLMNEFLELLDARQIEFMVAPYSAVNQLAYMLSEDILDVIYSSTDCLLVDNVEKFVWSIDLESRSFKFFEKNNVLSKLVLNQKQLRDIAMCVGNGYQPTVLEIFPHIPSTPNFSSLREFVLNNGSIYNAIFNLQDSQMMDTFRKGCSSVKFMPVLKVNGRIEPIQSHTDVSFLTAPVFVPPTSAASTSTATSSGVDSNNGGSVSPQESSKVPNDLHQLVGQRLPDELFFYQSVGLNVFQLCEILIHDYAIERLPGDMLSSNLYTKLVTDYDALELKGKVLNLITSSLNRYYQNKKLSLKSYLKGYQSLELSQKFSPSIYLTTRSLVVHHSIAKSFDLNTLLSSITDDFITSCKVSSKPSDDQLISSNYEIIASSTLRSLYLLDFIKDDFKLSKWGVGIFELISKSANSDKLFLILYLLKKFEKTLSVSDLVSLNDFKSTAKQSEKDCCVLISKIVSLLQIKNLKPFSYQGKVSRPLLQFRSLMNKINSNVSELITANILALLLSNGEDISKYIRYNDNWRQLASEVPFAKSLPSDLLGIITQTFWETYYIKTSSLSTSDKEAVSTGLTETIEQTNEKFKSIHENPYSEVIRGFKFFKEVTNMVKLLHNEKLVSDKVFTLFEDSEVLVNGIIDQL